MKFKIFPSASIAFFSAIFILAMTAGADVIKLKDGTKIDGEIIAKSEKQVVIKVGDEFKTLDRSKIESIESDKKDDTKKEKTGQDGAKSDKDDKAKKEEPDKDLTAVKRLYRKWQRNRKELVCPKCKGDGKLSCKRCGGKGFVRSLSVGGGQGKVRCRDCMGKGKFDCKKCKTTGRQLSKVKVLFWDILDPDYKQREGVAADKEAAIKKGISTAQGKSGFTLKLDASKLTKKFNLVKDLKYEMKGDYAAVTWKCSIGDESWTEGIVFRKVNKKWYWVPDKATDEIPGKDK